MEEIYNRELSWLQFNDRVLQEAMDESVPLMQRLRFLGIYSNNQDEFIKVRVANLIRYNTIKNKGQSRMTGDYTPSELLPLINQKVEDSQITFRSTYEKIIGEMEEKGVYVVNETMLSDGQKEFALNYFTSVVSRRLVPIIIRKSVDLPFLPDGKIYLAVKLENGASSKYAIIQIPESRDCPRFVVLPSAKDRIDIIFLDDIIRLFLKDIFFMFNYEKITANTFKIVRDAELTFDDDVSKSLTQKIFQGISKREKGTPVRLVYDREMPLDVLNTISRKFGFKSAEQIEAGGRYHLMRDLMKFPVVRQDLENSNPKPMLHPLVKPFESFLKVIRRRDILLCYPYQTFNHFIDLLREAAVDPKVQSIYISLYREALHSKVVNALVNAAKNGKHVIALVELKARFDEEQNLEYTTILQRGGVKVIHSPDELKVHSKLILIERNEGTKESRGYVYVGTGNFNEDTTNIYSDFGFFTSSPVIAEDARKLFDFLQNPHKHYPFKKLMVSPFYMRKQIENLIENEIRNSKKGLNSYFYGKFNSLTDEKLIKLLYKASKYGVKIRLIVRSACCLQAGINGLSENIEVRSIIDKYLEHARMIITCNNDDPQHYIMSADIMTRNLDRRVEVGVIIDDQSIKDTLTQYFNIEWNDNVKSRLVEPPYENKYVRHTDEKFPYRSQVELYKYFQNLKYEP